MKEAMGSEGPDTQRGHIEYIEENALIRKVENNGLLGH